MEVVSQSLEQHLIQYMFKLLQEVTIFKALMVAQEILMIMSLML